MLRTFRYTLRLSLRMSQLQKFSTQKPDFVVYRLNKWIELKQKYQNLIQNRVGKPIRIVLPDQSSKEGQAFVTTPIDIAKSISQSLANAAIVARVDGELWDLGRPLEENCKLEILKFDDPDAQQVFWHSSSHILGQALERVYSCLLCKGPALEEGGFYYESFMGDKIVYEKDYPVILKEVKRIISEKQPFERIVMLKEDALELFKYSKFKCEVLHEKVKDGEYCTVYKCGDLIDPCRGPHLLHTGKVKAFDIIKNSSSYWRADSSKESLQRVYGISFPESKMLEEWKELQEQLKQRDHRVIGQKQELWIPHKMAPGMMFFLPHGQRIYNTLLDLIKKVQRKRGFLEVQTPNMLSTDLWKISGHYDHYKENMFLLNVDNSEHGLKPMNCPAHCLIFDYRPRSYRELPLRISDFGVLHRNELRGALTGMTRVRRFQLDDAHIFCREDQIEQEISACLYYIEYIYNIFGFTPKYKLATRPEKFLGNVKVWERAEAELEKALKKTGKPYSIAKGDGAFYGPKIDITIEDALKREHQCATVQLDFNLPERFNLLYNTESSSDSEVRMSRPVMIHNATYGSFERFLAMITEHYGGKWPFWLSPRQICVLPVSDKFNDYAKQVKDILHDEGFYVDVDDSNANIKKKVRNAQLSQYNFMLIVGNREQENKTVNIRTRENQIQGEKKIEEAVKYFVKLRDEFK